MTKKAMTVKEKQKLKLECTSCEKTLVSWWFHQGKDGSFSDECKYCIGSDELYRCKYCKVSNIPYKQMQINRGNIQVGCKKCDSNGSKKRYYENRTWRLGIVKEYTRLNYHKVRIYQRWYHSQPHQRIRHSLHQRIYKLLKSIGTDKVMNTMPYLGCSLEFFLEWMEFQFYDDEMSFNNYGEWHMDHCKPCSAFDLLNIDEQMECFHWTNLQPMWGAENLSKSNTYTEEMLEHQRTKVAAFKLYYFEENSELSPDDELGIQNPDYFKETLEEELETELGPQLSEAFQYHPTEETHVAEPQGNLVEALTEQSEDAGHGKKLEGLGNQQPSPYKYLIDDLDDPDF